MYGSQDLTIQINSLFGKATIAWILAGGSFCLPLRKLKRTGTCSPRFLTAKEQTWDLRPAIWKIPIQSSESWCREAKTVYYSINFVAGGSIQCPVEWVTAVKTESKGVTVSVQLWQDKQTVPVVWSVCARLLSPLSSWSFSEPVSPVFLTMFFQSICSLPKLPRAVSNDKLPMMLSTTKNLIPVNSQGWKGPGLQKSHFKSPILHQKNFTNFNFSKEY